MFFSSVINSLDTSTVTNQECIIVFVFICGMLSYVKNKNPRKYEMLKNMYGIFLNGVKFRNLVAYLKLQYTKDPEIIKRLYSLQTATGSGV